MRTKQRILCFFPLYLIIFISVDPSAITAAEMSTTPMPSFVGSIQNVTASVGSDVMFTCTVENLNQFAVVWIRYEHREILAVGMKVLNSRVRVSHSDRRTWNLHFQNIQMRDSGRFTCRINKEFDLLQQTGFLHVEDIIAVTTVPIMGPGPEINSRNSSLYPPLVDIVSTGSNAIASRNKTNNNTSACDGSLCLNTANPSVYTTLLLLPYIMFMSLYLIECTTL